MTVNLVLAVVDFLSQLAIVALGFWLVVSPEVLLDNLSFFGETPTLTEFLLAIPIGTVAYTGIETISNMAGEARDHETTIPAAIKRVMIAVFAIYFTLPLVALSALPVECVAGECRTQLGVPPVGGRLRERPDHRRRVGHGPRRDAGLRRGLRRRARGHDPHRGDERRRARRLAADVLDGHVPPAAGHDAAPAPPLPDAVRRDPRLLRRSPASRSRPGQADFLGKIYAFGAMLSFSMAHLSLIALRVIAARRAPPVPQPRHACAGAATSCRCWRSSASPGPRCRSSSSARST